MDGGLLLVAGRTAEFTVEGEPRGKERQRHRVVMPKYGGKPFVQTYTPQDTQSYERQVYLETIALRRRLGMFEGPVRISILIGMPIPASYTKTKKREIRQGLIAHTGKPDIDNVVKAVLDGLVRSSGQGATREHVGLLKDDTQVVQLNVIKDYTDEPRVTVRVTELVLPDALTGFAKEPSHETHD